ncbi:Amino oxidase domain-containing protein [Citrus sinensis]|uniref:Amino oxidase domain-containing protein n=1 Tax=Citrus sinensis TaxID=2711 RepID=A0ACB8J136_CITSI|nr:Amino oxidase domain-containing protein [Citrus sinensis]
MWRRSFSNGVSLTRTLKDKKWDALVIGGGHNGLIAAAYLARGGLSVAVLERRHVIGGAAVTEELIPGFKFSRCSYLQSLLRPSVIRELELKKHGLKLLKPIATSFTPCLDGLYLLLGFDDQQNNSEISKFSKRDADTYPRYENELSKFCKIMDFLLDSPPPEALHGDLSFHDLLRDKMQKSVFWARCLRHVLSLGQKDLVFSVNLSQNPESGVVWCSTELIVHCSIGTLNYSRQVSMHPGVDTCCCIMLWVKLMVIVTFGRKYFICEVDVNRNDATVNCKIVRHVEGGMGSVSLAISKAATKAGAHILVNTEVSQIMIGDSGEVDGVLLVDGTRVHSSFVLSNATPYKTFMVRSVLLGLVPRDVLPDDFLRAIKYSDYHSGVTKINVAVDKLPQFHCCKSSQLEVGPHHTATVHIGCESMEEIGSACQDAWNGLPSRRPVMEMTIPSSLDKTISPPGKHVVSLFTQYTPYKPSDGSWEDPTYRESYAQKCFSLIDEYAPGFSSSVIGYDLLTPPDLEREFGLTGNLTSQPETCGNIFHGAMGLDSLFLMRPVKGWSGYRTPVRGLYLCGSGSHPGGGVMGAPGRNAAHVVLQDFKKQSR